MSYCEKRTVDNEYTACSVANAQGVNVYLSLRMNNALLTCWALTVRIKH